MQWIELTSLFRILALFARSDLESGFSIRLPPPPPPNKRDSATLSFIVTSGFLKALGDVGSHLKKPAAALLPRRLNEEVRIRALNDAISRYYERQAVEIEQRYLFEQDTSTSAWKIDLRGGAVHTGEYSLCFHAFGYDQQYLRDRFVMPITLLIKQKTSDDAIFRTLEASRQHLEQLGPMVFEEVKNTFANELISNAFEHGGDVILCAVRIGDAALRERAEIEEVLFDYKSDFFRYCTTYGSHFIDIIVADNGEGICSTLTNAFCYDEAKRRSSDKRSTTQPSTVLNELTKKRDRRLILHRYSLSPLSSRKQRPDPLYTTGLGVISQHVINGYATLAIKDQSDLSYFNPNNCKHPTAPGLAERASQANYGMTILNVLLPTSDIHWRASNHLIQLRPRETVAAPVTVPPAEYGYILVQQARADLSFSYDGDRVADKSHEILHDVSIERSKGVLLSNVAERVKELGCRFVVLDMADFRVARKKSIWIPLVACLEDCIRLGSAPVLANLDIASFRILQTLVDTLPRTKRPFIERQIVALLLSDSFDVFWCGQDNCAGARQELNKYLQDGVLSAKIEPMLKAYGIRHDARLKVSAVNALLNTHRSAALLRDVRHQPAFHTHNCSILTYRGDTSGEYYRTRELISSRLFQARYIKDVKRLISHENFDHVIVDAAELATTIRSIQRLGWRTDLRVTRVRHSEFESIDRCKDSQRILIMPTAVRSGRTLMTTLAVAQSIGLRIAAIAPLFDLRAEGSDAQRPGSPYLYFPFVVTHLAAPPPGPPQYFATESGALLTWEDHQELIKPLFRTILSEAEKYQLLQEENLTHFGHEVEGGHHYDLFVNVRKALNGTFHLTNVFIREMLAKAANADVVAYPGHSELTHILSLARTNRNMRSLEFVKLSISAVGHVTLVDKLTSRPMTLRDKRVLLLDEGIYTYATLTQCVRAILAESPKSVTILLIELRHNAGFPNMIFRDLRRNARCSIDCSTLLQLNIPTYSQETCPVCTGEGKGLLAIGDDAVLDPSIHVDDLVLHHASGAAIWAFERLEAGGVETQRLLKAMNENSRSSGFIVLLQCLLLRGRQILHHVGYDRLKAVVRLGLSNAPNGRQRAAILQTILTLDYPFKPALREAAVLNSIADLDDREIEPLIERTLKAFPALASKVFSAAKELNFGPNDGTIKRIVQDIARACTPAIGFYESVHALQQYLGYFVGSDHIVTRDHLAALEGARRNTGDAYAHLSAVIAHLQHLSISPIAYHIQSHLDGVVLQLRNILSGTGDTGAAKLMLYDADSPLRRFLTNDIAVPAKTVIAQIAKVCGVTVGVNEPSKISAALFITERVFTVLCENIVTNLQKYSTNQQASKVTLIIQDSLFKFTITNVSTKIYDIPEVFETKQRYSELHEEIGAWFGGIYRFQYDRQSNVFTTELALRRLYYDNVQHNSMR